MEVAAVVLYLSRLGSGFIDPLGGQLYNPSEYYMTMKAAAIEQGSIS